MYSGLHSAAGVGSVAGARECVWALMRGPHLTFYNTCFASVPWFGRLLMVLRLAASLKLESYKRMCNTHRICACAERGWEWEMFVAACKASRPEHLEEHIRLMAILPTFVPPSRTYPTPCTPHPHTPHLQSPAVPLDERSEAALTLRMTPAAGLVWATRV